MRPSSFHAIPCTPAGESQVGLGVRVRWYWYWSFAEEAPGRS
jgi:hypothetical protein